MSTNVDPASLVIHRKLWIVGLLLVVTLGLYGIYLVYSWAKVINQLEAKRRFRLWPIVLVSCVTLGVGAVIRECLIAVELDRNPRQASRGGFLAMVFTFNIVGILFGVFVYTAVLGFALGVAASILVQDAFNRLS